MMRILGRAKYAAMIKHGKDIDKRIFNLAQEILGYARDARGSMARNKYN